MNENTRALKRSFGKTGIDLVSRAWRWAKDREGLVIMMGSLIAANRLTKLIASGINAIAPTPPSTIVSMADFLLFSSLVVLGYTIAVKRKCYRDLNLLSSSSDLAAEEIKSAIIPVGRPLTFTRHGTSYTLLLSEIINTEVDTGKSSPERFYGAKGEITLTVKNYWSGRPQEKTLPINVTKQPGRYLPNASPPVIQL